MTLHTYMMCVHTLCFVHATYVHTFLVAHVVHCLQGNVLKHILQHMCYYCVCGPIPSTTLHHGVYFMCPAVFCYRDKIRNTVYTMMRRICTSVVFMIILLSTESHQTMFCSTCACVRIVCTGKQYRIHPVGTVLCTH